MEAGMSVVVAGVREAIAKTGTRDAVFFDVYVTIKEPTMKTSIPAITPRGRDVWMLAPEIPIDLTASSISRLPRETATMRENIIGIENQRRPKSSVKMPSVTIAMPVMRMRPVRLFVSSGLDVLIVFYIL